MGMNVTPTLSLQSADLRAAKMPITGPADFEFSFYLVSPDFTESSRQDLAQKLEHAIPGLVSRYYNDTANLYLESNTKDHPELCRHLVTMLQHGGVEVTTMGTNYQKHPAFESIQPPANPPDCVRDFASFQRFIVESTAPAPAAKSKQAFRP